MARDWATTKPLANFQKSIVIDCCFPPHQKRLIPGWHFIEFITNCWTCGNLGKIFIAFRWTGDNTNFHMSFLVFYTVNVWWNPSTDLTLKKRMPKDDLACLNMETANNQNRIANKNPLAFRAVTETYIRTTHLFQTSRNDYFRSVRSFNREERLFN